MVLDFLPIVLVQCCSLLDEIDKEVSYTLLSLDDLLNNYMQEIDDCKNLKKEEFRHHLEESSIEVPFSLCTKCFETLTGTPYFLP